MATLKVGFRPEIADAWPPCLAEFPLWPCLKWFGLSPRGLQKAEYLELQEQQIERDCWMQPGGDGGCEVSAVRGGGMQ